MHRLVPRRVKGLAQSIKAFDAVPGQNIQQIVARQLDALAKPVRCPQAAGALQEAWRGRTLLLGSQRAVQVVGHAQHVVQQALLAGLRFFLSDAPLALAIVVHLGLQAQGAIAPVGLVLVHF